MHTLLSDPSWSFAELSQKQKTYATHGYHRYPAKFIPHLANRLIAEYSKCGDLIVDPFMGSGTVLVEAKLLGRPSIGVDVNPVAALIAQAKTAAIDPGRLAQAIKQIRNVLNPILNENELTLFDEMNETEYFLHHNIAHDNRLHYWFDEETLRRLTRIQAAIDTLFEEDMRIFFSCAISHILKPLSFWDDRSIKPIRKLDKRIPEIRRILLRHIARMQRGNQEFWDLLHSRNLFHIPVGVYCADARYLPVQSGAAQLIVTSPPYVTSYEYLDLHQLSSLWFRWMKQNHLLRDKFIGTSSGPSVTVSTHNLHSSLAASIVEQAEKRCPYKAHKIARYFSNMLFAFQEMYRLLRPSGYACIIIGNTKLCDVEIRNADVFVQQLQSIGFSLQRIIVREIPTKTLPRTRDKATGRFTSVERADYIAYPIEYVIVVQKIGN